MNQATTIGAFVGIVLIVVIVYFIWKSQKKKGKKVYRQYKSRPIDIFYVAPIDRVYLESSISSQEFTLGMCIIIKNWYYNYTNWKLIGYHGAAVNFDSENARIKNAKNAALCVATQTAFGGNHKTPIWKRIRVQHPGLWLEPYVNNMRVVMNGEFTTIKNIPVGSWFYLYITGNKSTVEVYINGSLINTTVLKNRINITSNNFNFGSLFGSEGTFNGSIYDFRYANYIYTTDEIRKISKNKTPS